MTWLPSSPNIRVTTNARDAKNAIAPSSPPVFIGQVSQICNANTPTSQGLYFVPTYHASTQVGDLLLMIFMVAKGSGSNPVIYNTTGWTSLFDSSYSTDQAMVRVYYKIRAGGENFEFQNYGVSTGLLMTCTIQTWRGVNPTTPIVETGTVWTSTSGSRTTLGPIPGISIANGNVGMVVGCSINSTDTTLNTFTNISGDSLTWTNHLNYINATANHDGSTGVGKGAMYISSGINTTSGAVTISDKTITRATGTTTFGTGYSIGRMFEIQTATP
jgi:hypothetical protein